MRISKPAMLTCTLAVALCLTPRSHAQQSNDIESPGRTTQQLPDSPGASQQKSAIQADKADEAKHSPPEQQTKMDKLRDLLDVWISGDMVRKDEKVVAPTGAERRHIYFHQTFTSPGAYLKRMFGAAIDQARRVPEWQGGWGGYGERFASREGQFIAANSLSALGNAALGYEVGYDQCKCEGAKPRLRHAIMRNFLTYNRGEHDLHPQWALYAAQFVGGAIASTWQPNPPNWAANGGWAVLGQAGYGAAINVASEFVKEVNRQLGAK